MSLEELVFSIFSTKTLLVLVTVWVGIMFYQEFKYRKYIASQLDDINRRLDLAFDKLEKQSKQ
jgi:hypothetical protein